MDANLCNDVTIKEGVCSLGAADEDGLEVMVPIYELEFTEITKNFELRWLNFGSNLRNMYFQNAFKLYNERENFEFSFAYRSVWI